MNAKIIRILIHSLPDPTINRRLSVKKDQFPFICMISQLWGVIYNTNSYKKYLLCCTTYKSVFDTPNQSVTFTPKTR